MARVRTVDRAISILIAICERTCPIGLSQISREMGLDKATTRRLLVTLCEREFVQQDPSSRAYLPGPAISRLHKSVSQDIRAIAHPLLESLMSKVQETVCLLEQQGNMRVCIDAVQPEQELRIVALVGRAEPITRGASGRVFMAFRPDQEYQKLFKTVGLPALTRKSITSPEAYHKQVAEVRRKGYEIGSNDVLLGSAAVAAPIFGAPGKLLAVLTVRGPSMRLTPAKQQAIASDVVATAEIISKLMG